MSFPAENHIKQLLSSTPAIIYSCRAKGDHAVTFVSDNFTSLFGFSVYEALQPNFWQDNIHPDDKQRVISAYGALFTDGHFVCEYRFLKKDGSFFWVHDESRLICDDGGWPTEIVGSWLDITDRKKSEQALRESEALFRNLFHLNPVATIISSLSGEIHLVNPAFEKEAGLTAEEVIGKTAQDLGFWHAPGAREKMVKAISEQGFMDGFETQFYGEGGKLMTCLLSSRAIPLGDETRILSVLIDVTEKRESEEKLRKSEQLFKSFFTANPIATIISSAEGTVHMVNNAFTRTTGYASDEVVGKTVQEMRFWRDIEDRNRMVSELQEHGVLNNFESHFYGKDDRPMTCLISSCLIEHEGEARILSIVIDVTEQRKAEDESRKLEKAKSDFISTIAHELRTPLIAIVGYCELLENAAGFPLEENTKQEYLEIIHSNAEVLNLIVSDLLDMGRIRLGRSLGLSLKETDLFSLVDKIILSAKPRSTRHELIVECSEVFPRTIMIDPGRFTQVLNNLLSNAMKYSPDGGVVTIGMDAGDGYALVSVADEGIGMSQEQVERMFDRFYRADPESAGSLGLGLGLCIAKQIADEHAGELLVKSCLGKGTTVTLKLPLKS